VQHGEVRQKQKTQCRNCTGFDVDTALMSTKCNYKKRAINAETAPIEWIFQMQKLHTLLIYQWGMNQMKGKARPVHDLGDPVGRIVKASRRCYSISLTELCWLQESALRACKKPSRRAVGHGYVIYQRDMFMGAGAPQKSKT